jgi:hypothetical protein
MTAYGARTPCLLSSSAAGRTGDTESFSTLTAEVHPFGSIETAFGTLHFNLPDAREPSIISALLICLICKKIFKQ